MKRVESALFGTPLANSCERITQDLFTELAPIDDVRAPAQYRREAQLRLFGVCWPVSKRILQVRQGHDLLY